LPLASASNSAKIHIVSNLAALGNVAIDVIDDGRPQIGGGPYHCGQGLRLLERRAHVVAKCAPEDRALAVPPLAALGLQLTMVDAEHTAAFALRYDGEVRRTELRAVGDPWTPDDLAAIGKAQWVHVAPLVQTDFPAETMEALAVGRKVSYDGQGLVRCADLGPVRFDDQFDRDILRNVTFLKLAEEEASVILRNVNEESVKRLGVPEVVVTYGSRGSVVYAGGDTTPVPCHPIQGVDLTGCGDVFGVGYLAARSDGLGPVAAARRATALVALLLTNRKRRR
jgi:sugar/nucleoside kinase (ribokinase family)